MAIMREDLSTQIPIVALVGRGTSEVTQNRASELSMDQSDLDVFQCALSQRTDEAWCQLFERFQGLVLSWAYHHPQHDLAARYYPLDSYVALAFERFWQATARHQSLTFSELGAALSYLKACLNGAILDTLRWHARPEMPLLEACQLHEAKLTCEDLTSDQEIWEAMKALLSNVREQRIAYLLFHCGLKPREIVHFCQDEFSQVEEVYRIRRTLMDRLLRHADLLRWRLSDEA